ncbi:ABC transporter ATP-binding protein [Schumannella soli]|uniref:ABC transporter ATP-binding protein n=1 Tax=Schumannella soli TaxID=2590779 RepID=A0A506Y6Z1_9MICO|nr:ABC transporter ATP-binding protein [Schumannella soli]TPW77785.1 ABC transporter ATP-binding protein [Schumannella soli]
MANSIAELTDVGRSYGAARVLDAVNLTLRTGESVAIIGPSGSGKSTLLSILGLLDTPSTGSYRLNGVEVAGAKARQRTQLRRSMIGFVFQAFHLVPHLTVRENVLFGMYAKGLTAVEDATTAEAQLAAVGLGHRMHALPSSLSGGEQQRTALARALAVRPTLLLCDEPTGNLDSKNSASVLNLLMDSVAVDRGLVIVTHDTAVADRCERVIQVADGRVSE